MQLLWTFPARTPHLGQRRPQKTPTSPFAKTACLKTISRFHRPETEPPTQALDVSPGRARLLSSRFLHLRRAVSEQRPSPGPALLAQSPPLPSPFGPTPGQASPGSSTSVLAQRPAGGPIAFPLSPGANPTLTRYDALGSGQVSTWAPDSYERLPAWRADRLRRASALGCTRGTDSRRRPHPERRRLAKTRPKSRPRPGTWPVPQRAPAVRARSRRSRARPRPSHGRRHRGGGGPQRRLASAGPRARPGRRGKGALRRSGREEPGNGPRAQGDARALRPFGVLPTRRARGPRGGPPRAVRARARPEGRGRPSPAAFVCPPPPPASQNGPSSGNGAALLRRAPARAPRPPPPRHPTPRPGAPRSAAAATVRPTSKETRPKGSPSAAMSKNTMGLPMAGLGQIRGGGGGVCKAARAVAPASLIAGPGPAQGRSRAAALANRDRSQSGVTACLASVQRRRWGGGGAGGARARWRSPAGSRPRAPSRLCGVGWSDGAGDAASDSCWGWVPGAAPVSCRSPRGRGGPQAALRPSVLPTALRGH